MLGSTAMAVAATSALTNEALQPSTKYIFHISYLICLGRVALQRKLFFKGPSNKKTNYNLQLKY